MKTAKDIIGKLNGEQLNIFAALLTARLDHNLDKIIEIVTSITPENCDALNDVLRELETT